MFLDDKLYQHIINKNEIQNVVDLQTTINELYKICEDHFKPLITKNISSYREIKIIMDRVFNSWDLFIQRLDKEDYFLTDIISEASYKTAYMKNSECKRIYDSGK